MEHITCGYIKAKFPYNPDLPLPQQTAFTWAKQFQSCRITEHYIYVQFGHKTIRDNDHALDILDTIARFGGKITRIDLCVDVMGLFPYDATYDLWDTGKPPWPSLIKSPHGKTLYIGKRSSARFLRIYNKRAEILYRKKLDVGFDFYRVEIEVKRNAIPLYLALFRAGNERALVGDIAKRYKLETILGKGHKLKPTDIPDKEISCFAFIHRYKRILKEAYTTDRAQFLEIIGV